jgi:hypothetical protein
MPSFTLENSLLLLTALANSDHRSSGISTEKQFSVITRWCLQFWFCQSFSRLISVFGFGSTSLFQDLSVFLVLVLPVFFKTYQCFRFWFYQSFSRLISVFGYRFLFRFYQSFSRLIWGVFVCFCVRFFNQQLCCKVCVGVSVRIFVFVDVRSSVHQISSP